MLRLTPIGNEMEKIKRLEKTVSDDSVIIKEKQAIKGKISPEVLNVIKFLANKKINTTQSLLLNLLREKLKSYQNELNLKFLTIYEIRDQFEAIKASKKGKK